MPDTANLDQFVAGLSPTLQLIINGVVLIAAVAAAVYGYFRKGRAAAPVAPPAHEVSAQVVGGALADRASMNHLAESNHELAVAIRGLTAVIEKSQAQAAESEAEEDLNKRIADLVDERLRAPPRRPSR